MATAAQSSSSLNVPGPDDMDLLSDTGYDFGDGDIDLDLDSATGFRQQQDDDLSLQDAGLDADLEVQTASADQDDFMADNEDIINEDIVGVGNENPMGSQRSPLAIQSESDMPEEDLIDYSDDEDDQAQNVSNGVSLTEYQEEKADATEAITQQRNDDDAEPTEPSADANNLSQENSKQGGGNAQGFDTNEEHPWDGQAWEPHSDAEHNTTHENEGSEHGHEEPESDIFPVEGQVEGHGEGSNDHEASPYDAEHSEHAGQVGEYPQISHEETNTRISLHPITVYYDGIEYWMFKRTNSEEGDWLLEDESLADGEMRQIFQACRTALGSDVTDDIEIGLRFDHFHSMELYEDNTACACVSLRNLVDFYLRLHEQDGTENPESFYITLQFRPRFFTLLGDVKKAIDSSAGFTGLNTAIAAGETSFNVSRSHEPTEQGYENYEQDNQEVVEQHDRSDQHEEYHEEYHGNYDGGDNEIHGEHHEEARTTEDASPEHHSYIEDQGETQVADDQDASQPHNVSQPNAARSNSESAPAQDSNDEDQEDLIDYSDEEDETNAPQTGQASTKEPSPSSSTVQGDDDISYPRANLENLTNPTEPIEVGGQPDDNYNVGADRQASTEPSSGIDFGQYDEGGYTDQQQYDGQLYGGHYDQEFAEEQTVQIFDDGVDATLPNREGESNHLYQNLDTAPVDQQVDFTLSGGPGDEVDADPNIGDDDRFADVDGLVDLTADDEPGSTTGVLVEDEINFDDEDGAPEQEPVTSVSQAAEPVAASSSGLQELESPQGLKRPIDDISNGDGDATDPADAKRQRL